MPTQPKTHEQRMMEYVQITGFCWLWTGALEGGYGFVRHAGKHTTAHRYVYEYLVGPIPEGLQLDHLCRVRHCVNPDHVEPVTIQENVARGRSFSALNTVKTHCLNGHEFTPENTIQAKGGRACERCRYERIRKWRKDRAEASGRVYIPRGGSHCPQGHEFTEDNTYNCGQGRRCRACNKARRLEADQAQLDSSFTELEIAS